MKKSIIYFIVFLGLQATASIIVTGCWRLITGNSDITTTNLIVTSVLSSGLTIALFLLARWAVVSPNWLRSRQWTVLIWSVVAAMGTIIPSMWIQEHMPDLPNLLENEFDQLLSSRMGYFTLALLAPLAEEIVFRGAVLKALLGSYRPWTAIVVSAVFFHRSAAGLDVLSHRQHSPGNGLPLVQQQCGLRTLQRLSRPGHPSGRHLQRVRAACPHGRRILAADIGSCPLSALPTDENCRTTIILLKSISV